MTRGKKKERSKKIMNNIRVGTTDELPSTDYFDYDLPFSERYEKFVEPLIKPICDTINKSGWVWTGESCEGHTKDNPSDNWGTEVIRLRLIVSMERVSDLLFLIYKHTRYSGLYIEKCDKVWVVLMVNFSWTEVNENRKMVGELAKAITDHIKSKLGVS